MSSCFVAQVKSSTRQYTSAQSPSHAVDTIRFKRSSELILYTQLGPCYKSREIGTGLEIREYHYVIVKSYVASFAAVQYEVCVALRLFCNTFRDYALQQASKFVNITML